MMRELTSDEQGRLLTQEQVDRLPDGTHIMVKWGGGNGPHEYITERYEGAIYTVLPNWSEPSHVGKLDQVGTGRSHDRVFFPIKKSK
jgi:hypothetical protein